MILIGNETPYTGPKRTQTYTATHDGAGNRLPIMRRSFMSFSYGGKWIEDFYLVATIDNRINKNIYAAFEDSKTEYTTIDGSFYWGTRMTDHQLNFTLSTDYMTENMLDEFKRWFRPGVERDLILAEHPNRYIRARVQDMPVMNMLPFGEKVDVVIGKDDENNGKSYSTMTTIYKGDIDITFIMDEPYWTGILNYMPYPGTPVKQDVDERVKNLVNEIITNNSLNSEDALKICLEDQIPNNIVRDNNNYLLGSQEEYTDIILSRIGEAKLGQAYISYMPSGPRADYARVGDIITKYSVTDQPTITITPEDTRYLFYSGTAPSKPILEFTLQMNMDANGYIINPTNSFNTENKKSYIKVGEKYFYFTTPSICTNYNRALDIVYNAKDDLTIYELRKEFREKLKNKWARQWAIYCIKEYSLNSTLSSFRSEIVEKIREFFNADSNITYNFSTKTREINYCYKARFSFNSKNGISKGWFNCKTINSPAGEEIEENVGDMVLSDYLIIDERNNLNEYGQIEKDNCTPITTSETLSNFSISYDNMYY